MRARIVLAVAAVLVGVPAAPVLAAAHPTATTVDVQLTGDVANPATYTGDDLAALPQVTLPDHRSRARGAVTGVDLDMLVTAAAPVLPADAKNGQLRVLVTVIGASGARTVALGELDPGFGNHPALLALQQDGSPAPDGPTLAFPGDRGYARTVTAVTQIDVTVVTPAVPTPAAGAVVVTGPDGTTTLTAERIAALPTLTRTVTFLSGPASATHTESGPSLISVLRAAHVRRTPTTGVAAVGSDGYVATVTPGEATSGRRPLLLSTVEDGVPLTQPRLVTAGDVRGGRYVSSVVELSITQD